MRRRSVMRERNNAYLLNQQQAVNVQYPPPPPGGWGNPAPGGPSQYPPYPPKNEYEQYQAGYTGGFSATPQEPPKTYNPGQPGVSAVVCIIPAGYADLCTKVSALRRCPARVFPVPSRAAASAKQ